jgi:hypothetical protein
MLRFTERHYDNAGHGREGIYRATGLSLGRYFLQRKYAAQVGVRVLDFEADDDRYGYEGYEMLAGLVVKAWPGGTLYARANHRDVQYDDNEAVGVARDEIERRLAAGFQHDFSAGHLDKWTLGAVSSTPITNPTFPISTTTGVRSCSIWDGPSDHR